MTYRWQILLILNIAASCATATKGPAPATGASLGWVAGPCFAIKNPSLRKGDTIHGVRFSQPDLPFRATVLGPATDASACPALLPDRRKVNDSHGRYFYLTDLEGDPGLVGIGLIGDKDHDIGQREWCNTTEGIRFRVADVQGNVLWSDNYYLGYDQRPNCP
jgi:hypothetical protein